LIKKAAMPPMCYPVYRDFVSRNLSSIDFLGVAVQQGPPFFNNQGFKMDWGAVSLRAIVELSDDRVLK
jgi:hypothetical protein